MLDRSRARPASGGVSWTALPVLAPKVQKAILDSIEINPLLVRAKGAVARDALIVPAAAKSIL